VGDVDRREICLGFAREQRLDGPETLDALESLERRSNVRVRVTLMLRTDCAGFFSAASFVRCRPVLIVRSR